MDFCPAPDRDLPLVRSLLTSVDCNIHAVSQAGYTAVSAPGSEFALGLTALMTIYVAVFGLRLLLGHAPLRVGDLTVMAIKLGVVLALATSWPSYQQLVFDTLFHGPEQVGAAILRALPRNAALGDNPFDGLQTVYDQMHATATFLKRTSPPTDSPFAGGLASAALSLDLSAFLALFATVGAMLVAKIVLGLLLALGPLFAGCLLFESTLGIFQGWLRVTLAFAVTPLIASLGLVLQLMLIQPYMPALAKLTDVFSAGAFDTSTVSAVFILTLVSSSVSLAGIIGLGIAVMGLKLPGASRKAAALVERPEVRSAAAAAAATQSIAASQPTQPRAAAIGAAAAALDRRDSRLESIEAPRRLHLGARTASETMAHNPAGRARRRPAKPHHAASSTRRDQ